ncbi:DUF411 domain-containing protein [Rhodocyclaceae bacterium SMB388]
MRSIKKLTHFVTGLVFAGTLLAGVVQAADPEVIVYKHPQCGCCGKWADHMRENGFEVKEVSTLDIALVKSEAGVPEALGSCHTATVGGYVVEGHVPASDVKRMLAEKPAIAGISAPGMPLGSPGMEGPYAADKYDVISFDADGNTVGVFSSH